MRIAVIGQPGAWSTERLAGALGTAGADVLVVDLADCSLRLPDPRLFHHGRPVEGLAGAVVKKIGDTAEGPGVIQRLNLLHHLERSGVLVLSPPGQLEVAVNRYRMTLELARAGVPVPDTLVTEDPAEAEAAVERFGAAVAKPLYTSKGRGMQRVDPSLDLRAFFTRWRREVGPIYLQRFIKHPGRDLGLTVLEGECLGAYWRIARDDQWMTTILSGGRYEAAEPTPAAVEIALRAAQHFGLLFTGVDLMETPEGGWVVLEVSAFGGFRGLREAWGVDAAPSLAAAALARFGRHRPSP